jgi:6-pyruvoyltetrahydropterin/6-carboxytetrahydropterin synthase
MIRLTRRYRFSASHRLRSPHLSEAENQELYGKCNNPHGHGHDYSLEVSVRGAVDEASGRVVNVEALDRLVAEHVLRAFDHKNLNSEVPEFAEAPPTTENVVLEIRRRLGANWKAAFPGATPVLERIRVHETKRNIFEISENR